MRTLPLALVLGCGGSKDEPADTGGDGAADADTDADTDTDTDADTDADTEPAGTASVQGIVSTASGPLASASLRFCRGTICKFGASDAVGAYAFFNVPSEWHSLEVVPPQGSSFATVLVPLIFADDQARVVDLAAVPLGAESPLGPSATEHAVAVGLYLTLDLDDLLPPLIGDVPTFVAGARIAERDWVPVDEIAGTVLAQWYLEPYDIIAADPAGIPARITNDFALAESATVEVYVASYVDSQWISAGTATVVGTDLVGASLPLISTLVVVQPPVQ